MGIFKKTHQKIIEYRWKKFVEENKDAASKYICGSYSEPSLKKKYKYKSPFVYRTPSIEDVLKNRELILSNYELEKTYRKVCDLVENYPYGTAVICRDKFRLCFIDVERMPGQVISKYAENNKTKTSFKELSESEIIREIARISSGTISNAALEHAKELRSA